MDQEKYPDNWSVRYMTPFLRRSSEAFTTLSVNVCVLVEGTGSGKAVDTVRAPPDDWNQKGRKEGVWIVGPCGMNLWFLIREIDPAFSLNSSPLVPLR